MKTGVTRLIVALLMTTIASATVGAADWYAFDLKGKVKSVTYYNRSSPYLWPYNDEVRTYSFDTAGKVKAPKNIKVIRNKKGVAIDFKYYMPDWDYWFSQKLTYNSNGTLKNLEFQYFDGAIYQEFHYDKNGRVCKIAQKEYCEGEEYTSITFYEYISFDKKGNWTKRKSKTNGSTNIETRKIAYYE